MNKGKRRAPAQEATRFVPNENAYLRYGTPHLRVAEGSPLVQNIKQLHRRRHRRSCSSSCRRRRCHRGRNNGQLDSSSWMLLLLPGGMGVVVRGRRLCQGRRRRNVIKRAFHSWPLGAVVTADAAVVL